jgi:hypothetical protein
MKSSWGPIALSRAWLFGAALSHAASVDVKVTDAKGAPLGGAVVSKP